MAITSPQELDEILARTRQAKAEAAQDKSPYVAQKPVATVVNDPVAKLLGVQTTRYTPEVRPEFAKPGDINQLKQEIQVARQTPLAVRVTPEVTKPQDNAIPQGWNRELTPGGVSYSGPNGSSLSGSGAGGGSFSETSGPGRPAEMSDVQWAAVPAAQKSQMNIAAYNQAADAEKQRRLQRTAAADGRQVDEATGTIKGTVGYDRAHGDVGSVGDTGGYGILDKGYEAARAADMNRRGAAEDMVHWASNHLGPKGRAAVATQVADNLSKPVSTGADIGDQIQLARLAQDQNQEANRNQLERQKMGLDLAKWDREQAGAAEGRASEAAYKKAQTSNMERTQQDKRAEDLDKVIGTSAGISAAPAELQGPLKQWASGLIGNMPASQATATVESALASALAEDQLTLKDLPNIKGDQLQKLYVRLQARLGKL